MTAAEVFYHGSCVAGQKHPCKLKMQWIRPLPSESLARALSLSEDMVLIEMQNESLNSDAFTVNCYFRCQ